MKKEYVSPAIKAVEGISEGVYMDSGDADCWTGDVFSVQNWNGSHNVFEMHVQHSADVEHISLGCTFTVEFSSPITNAYSENNWTCKVSGDTVTVTRVNHANAYRSGDNVTFKIWAQAADEATTKGLSATITGYKCQKSVNVQGRGGDGS